jgi:asparagine synthase (glutamine-hydrolysing)
MCGILGHFAIGDGRTADRVVWEPLVNVLAHRGPDDSTFWQDGRFTFGHRRLSIIDLSPAGRQPMSTIDGDLVVVFNGDIYNDRELRKELGSRGHRFRSSSDTEVLLHGYREWGVELPSKLRGMFAFAIADRRKQELFAARDRFGEKPFFYLEDRNGVSFASELKVLASLPDIPRDIDEDALAGYLCLNYVPGRRTMLRAIRRLGPGMWRLWPASGEPREAAYWRPPSPDEPPLEISHEEALERLAALFDEATRLSLRADVPVGVLLSGGIDSSLVAKSAARAGSLSTGYCLSFNDQNYSEWARAKRTARHLGLRMVEVRLDSSGVNDFHSLVEHADDPLADSSALAVWSLAREVSKTSKVVLSGDGGDELFGGYLTYRATLLHERITYLPMLLRRVLAGASRIIPIAETKVSTTYKLWRFLRAADLPSAVAHFTWNGTWLPDEASSLLADPTTKIKVESVLADLAEAHGLPARPSLRQLQTADTADYLPNDILVKGDRMSMAHGLEIRSPFFDPDLAEFALRLPASYKTGLRGNTKRILRALAKKSYDVEVAHAPKQGFSIPVHKWLRGPGRPLVEDLLSPASISSIPFLDANGVSRVVRSHMSGWRSYGFELWGLAVLAAWHRRYIQHRPPVPEGPLPEIVELQATVAPER